MIIASTAIATRVAINDTEYQLTCLTIDRTKYSELFSFFIKKKENNGLISHENGSISLPSNVNPVGVMSYKLRISLRGINATCLYDLEGFIPGVFHVFTRSLVS